MNRGMLERTTKLGEKEDVDLRQGCSECLDGIRLAAKLFAGLKSYWVSGSLIKLGLKRVFGTFSKVTAFFKVTDLEIIFYSIKKFTKC